MFLCQFQVFKQDEVVFDFDEEELAALEAQTDKMDVDQAAAKDGQAAGSQDYVDMDEPQPSKE